MNLNSKIRNVLFIALIAAVGYECYLINRFERKLKNLGSKLREETAQFYSKQLGLTQFSSFDEYINIILSETEKLDYDKILKDYRAVYFGEDHSIDEIRYEIGNHMEDFARNGFTHYGMEFLSVDMQPTLNKYFETGEGKEEILMYLAKECGLLGIITEASIEGASLYVQTIEAARENGLRILGLDLSDNKKDEMVQEINKLLKEGNVERANELEAMSYEKRERQMADIILEVLNIPNAKIITLTGAYHNNNISRVLGGDVDVSVDFVGGYRFWNVSLLEEAVRRVGLSNEKFMIKAQPNWEQLDNELKDDYFIHLPQ